jgi:polyribonucleotide nucleotidyltransferase
MVKVLAIEGNRIKLSRKALIKEQRAKLNQGAPGETESEAGEVESSAFEVPAATAVAATPASRNEFDERQPKSNQSTILIEGGDDFEDEEGGEEFDEESEPNFNRVDGAPAPVVPQANAARPAGAANNSNRRRRRRRPGGGSGRGPGTGGGQA